MFEPELGFVSISKDRSIVVTYHSVSPELLSRLRSYDPVNIVGAPNSPDPSRGRFLNLGSSSPVMASSSSTSLAFRSSSISHIGLGGRLREDVPPSGSGPDSGVGSRESFRSSSMSHAGLGSRGGRGRGAGGGRGASGIDAGGGTKLLLSLPSVSPEARSFPLLVLWLEVAADCWLARS